jgi:alkanesulfonate monooxygenase SsuD/methylene tetrahydromethanopterin reductase-like flavin-dependent oxidoreductase (luciferase family)
MHLDIALESKVGPAEFCELGLLAEKYGFRGIWAQNYARAPDAFMTAVPLALASKNINVGVAVVCPHEMHPLKIANAVLTLNEYAGGRASVVITAGGDWTGVLKAKKAEVNRTREALEIIKACTGDGVVKYAGEYYDAQAFTTSWKTQTPPTIYAGAHGPKMMHMAAGVADGIMLSDVQPEMFDRVMPIINEALATQEHAADMPLSNFVAWHVKEDREASLWEARRELLIRGWLGREWVEPFLNTEEAQFVLDNKWAFLNAFRKKSGDIEGVPEHIVSALVEGLSCAGDLSDLDRHIEKLGKYADAGFTEVALRIHDDPADSIRMIGEKVLPALR